MYILLRLIPCLHALQEKLFQFWFNTSFIDMHIMQQEAAYTVNLRYEGTRWSWVCLLKEGRGRWFGVCAYLYISSGYVAYTCNHLFVHDQLTAMKMFMCRRECEQMRSQHAASRGQPTRFTEVEHDKKVTITSKGGIPSNYQVGTIALFLGPNPVFVTCSTKKLG